MHMINMASSIGYPVQPGKDNACKRSPCRNAQAAQTAKKVLEASQTSRCARDVWLASNNRKRTLQKALPKYGLRLLGVRALSTKQYYYMSSQEVRLCQT